MNTIAKLHLVAAPPVADERLREIGASAYNGEVTATALELAAICGELVDARTAYRLNEELAQRTEQKNRSLMRLVVALLVGVVGCGSVAQPPADAAPAQGGCIVQTVMGPSPYSCSNADCSNCPTSCTVPASATGTTDLVGVCSGGDQ